LRHGNGSDIFWASTTSTSGSGNIGNEYFCYSQVVGETSASRGPNPRGISRREVCNSNATDPFLMQVTASAPALTVPDLSLTGMAVLSILLAGVGTVVDAPAVHWGSELSEVFDRMESPPTGRRRSLRSWLINRSRADSNCAGYEAGVPGGSGDTLSGLADGDVSRDSLRRKYR